MIFDSGFGFAILVAGLVILTVFRKPPVLKKGS
jgi:hypothetical protein